MVVLLLMLWVASYALTFSIGALYGLDNPDSFVDWVKQLLKRLLKLGE